MKKIYILLSFLLLITICSCQHKVYNVTLNVDELLNEYYSYETEYETCPDCGGTGKDNATLDWKCYRCNGLGRIKKEEKEEKSEY